jgi:hypothetical protein
MNEKNLCLALAMAEKEDDLISLLKKSGYWDNINVCNITEPMKITFQSLEINRVPLI